MRGWVLFSLIASALVACAAPDTANTLAVGMAPSAADVAATHDPPVPPTFLPAEVALPAVPSYGRDARRFVRRSEDEPDEVVIVPEELLAIPAAFRVRPLAELAPGVAELLDEAGGSVTAAVVVPSRGMVYVANPEVAVPMASVVKLVIMLALFDKAQAEGRSVTPEEIALLDPMVTWSDNDSASWLWDQLGGGPGIDAYLRRVGVGGIMTDPWAWGDSRASGAAVALLLARLAFGDLVSEEHRALALNLLSNVSTDQRWGIGGTLVAPEGAVVAVKDGWYPVAQGWRAGSAGVLVPPAGAPPGAVAYSIAVLTAQNDTLEGAIEVIQGIASLVHAALYPEVVTVLR